MSEPRFFAIPSASGFQVFDRMRRNAVIDVFPDVTKTSLTLRESDVAEYATEIVRLLNRGSDV